MDDGMAWEEHVVGQWNVARSPMKPGRSPWLDDGMAWEEQVAALWLQGCEWEHAGGGRCLYGWMLTKLPDVSDIRNIEEECLLDIPMDVLI